MAGPVRIVTKEPFHEKPLLHHFWYQFSCILGRTVHVLHGMAWKCIRKLFCPIRHDGSIPGILLIQRQKVVFRRAELGCGIELLHPSHTIQLNKYTNG